MAPESSAVKRGSGGTSQPDDGLKYEVKGSFSKECNSPSQLNKSPGFEGPWLPYCMKIGSYIPSLYNCS